MQFEILVLLLIPILEKWTIAADNKWQCPEIPGDLCSCDIPHTLRCAGNTDDISTIAASLANLPSYRYVSLLDLTLQNVEEIKKPILRGVFLQGLVISSGALRYLSDDAFESLGSSLHAIGLPNNKLTKVPTKSLSLLTSLTRLDLSHNNLHKLNNDSFMGLQNLTFIDLSGNGMQYISSTAFSELYFLNVLRLHMNMLSASVISKLQGLLNLKELDLSRNFISGPLTSTTLPKLPRLQILNLEHNQITNISKGILSGFDSLQILLLQFNMIDVLEDNAFRLLKNLTTLNLSNNRIVAIAELSLAHLTNLDKLDLSNNFLRALTSDLLKSLRSISDLSLGDNEISIISHNAFNSDVVLKKFTLSGNPLNCDCDLIPFSQWLRNSKLNTEDKESALCATPPSLENAFVKDLFPSQLVCEQQDSSNEFRRPITLSGPHVSLKGFRYRKNTISFLWNIDTTLPYHCDSLFVYEELGENNVLIQSNSLNCSSADTEDPHYLPISLTGFNLQFEHRYRYCLVMMEENVKNITSLMVGCSQSLTLKETAITPQVIAIKTNLTAYNTLSIKAKIWPENFQCLLKYFIYVGSHTFKQLNRNCSSAKAVIRGFPHVTNYKICASVTNLTTFCVQTKRKSVLNSRNNSHSGIWLFVGGVLILILICFYNNFYKCSFFRNNLCYSNSDINILDTHRHLSYMKLNTTKV